MTASTMGPTEIRVEFLHRPHPKIRAEDWRSPLIARLLDAASYTDGEKTINVSYRDRSGSVQDTRETLTWTNMQDDYERCLNTYQTPVLTEFAALGVACILCTRRQMEITEVTRRGEKVDYWIGDREALLEVSGTTSEDIAQLCDRKATQQLQLNPLGKSGFVCATAFHTGAARLWHYQR